MYTMLQGKGWTTMDIIKTYGNMTRLTMLNKANKDTNGGDNPTSINMSNFTG